MKPETHRKHKIYTTENSVEINISAGNEADMEQQQSYQRFINVVSNIVTKYVVEEKCDKK